MQSIVTWYVCLSATTVSPTKKAEPIDMPFGMWTRVGPMNHLVGGSLDPSRECSIFSGGGAHVAAHCEV